MADGLNPFALAHAKEQSAGRAGRNVLRLTFIGLIEYMYIVHICAPIFSAHKSPGGLISWVMSGISGRLV